MQVIRDLKELKNIKKPLALSLGNFDGVHRGHQALLKECIVESRSNNWASSVLILNPHPSLVVTGLQTGKLLNTPEQKLNLIDELGIEYAFILPFNAALADLAPEDFIATYLHDLFRVRKIYVGFNYTFGRKGSGTPSFLKDLGRQMNFEVSIIQPVVYNQEIISSTLIREKYSQGDILSTEKLLGYRPFLEGPVITGYQRGRSLGFPTANIQVAEYILLPAYGVYAVFAEYHNQIRPAIVNIGRKPTFGEDRTTVEVHILDYDGDLYGQHLRIHLVKQMRSEKKFKDPSELTTQVFNDIQEARSLLAKTPAKISHKSLLGK